MYGMGFSPAVARVEEEDEGARSATQHHQCDSTPCNSVGLSIKQYDSLGDACIKMVEQIHEIMGILVVKLHATSENKGMLPTALLYDIAKFTQILEKVFTLLKQQQRMGIIKQLFEHRNNAEKLEAYMQELNHTLEMFKIRAASLALAQIVQTRKDAKQCHEELVAHLESDSDITSCEHSSPSSGPFYMLPPSPTIFHGRESEHDTVVTILLQDSARIAILGMGGMGKTTLTIAALQNAQVELKYPQR
ncbi:hypothetical protein C8J57DRAFT_1230911 [Mycena rebaudengoi]|nr:hypothetical protein C8J57DRAFT_1230911 [Mycena rebaudengoi]